jgi:hypothetical protein
MVETMMEDNLTMWAEMQWGITMDKAGDVEAVRGFLENLLQGRRKS